MHLETLKIDVAGPIGHFTLNRPERLNALSSIMLRELAAAPHWFDLANPSQPKRSAAAALGSW